MVYAIYIEHHLVDDVLPMLNFKCIFHKNKYLIAMKSRFLRKSVIMVANSVTRVSYSDGIKI